MFILISVIPGCPAQTLTLLCVQCPMSNVQSILPSGSCNFVQNNFLFEDGALLILKKNTIFHSIYHYKIPGADSNILLY